ncbi:MAG TPA: hypothetical protein DCZ91_16880 [Lachnospiraceae bacterium]|nr:hypothetical protein [Lachnospiraceae bacterium]
MNKIKISCDKQKFRSKPSGDAVRYINGRIARAEMELSRDSIKEAVFNIGQEGCTFCPATFKNGKRNKDNFEQQQLIALDFDNKDTGKKISFEEVKQRADFYELPVLFAYDTLSSNNHDKFRVVFLNNVSITDRRVAEAVQMAVGEIFPEADPSCYKDVSKLYFGGKNVIYYDDKLPETNMESIFRNFTYCMKKKYKPNHYKVHLARFAKETGIALTANGLLDIQVSDYLPKPDNPIEDAGVKGINRNGKNSPGTIICSNIKEHGEIFPDKYYMVNFSNGSSSVKIADKKTQNHKPYRSAILQEICKNCRLFQDFIEGSRGLSHDELFGVATNLIDVETGIKYFMEVRLKHPGLYTYEKNDKWKDDLSYMVQNKYKPECCDKYCPYHKECSHGRNILTTVHSRRGSMEPVAGYHEEFCSMEEMQDDIYSTIRKALFSGGKKFTIVKAQVGGGKSHSYLKLMEEYGEYSFIVATPTNLLKQEIYKKADKAGIDVKVTPSLEEMKEEIPPEIYEHIDSLYKRGQYKSVQKFIFRILEKEDIPCLKTYIKKRRELRKWDKSLITTHRYLLSMDKKKLDKFDFIIIDEDIIFKSIISNQEQITVSQLEKLMEKTENAALSDKIEKLLDASENQSCIEAERLKRKAKIKDKAPFDLRAFCAAEKFYFRRSSEEENLDEDTFTFLKAASFPGERYIIVSATADQEVCNMYFGGENVDFYECKKARYMGILNQYPGKSMSRSCLAENPDIIRRLIRHFGMEESSVITFKNENIGMLHFGNTEGSNSLEGRNILVAGTPYHAKFIYMLAAFTMGLEFDEDEEMAPQSVVHNGYRFRFTTFQDEDLRAIHFWMIESELEQAVGRARLLRHNCTAHLFSNFPLCQANMISGFNYEKI